MIDASKVASVYTGRSGRCMCGCSGKYSYASRYRDRRPDYLEGDEGISDRSVSIIVGKLNRNPKTQIKDGIAWVDEGDRRLVAYMEDAA